MTKLHPEIKEALYDPESVQKAKDVLKYAVDKLLDPVAKKSKAKKERDFPKELNALNNAYNAGKINETEYQRKRKALIAWYHKQPGVIPSDSGTLTIKGDKKKMKKLAKHLAKEHPSTKGKIKVLDPAPKGQKQPIVSKAQRGAMFAEIDRREAKAEWQKKMKKGTLRGLRYDPLRINKKHADKFLAMQNWLKKHESDYSSEHETAIYRAITTSNTELEAARKLNKMRYGRLDPSQNQKGIKKLQDAIDIIEDMIRSYTESTYDPTPRHKIKLHSGIPSRWFEAMVKGIKNSSDVRNPYAIVKNIWLKLSPATKTDIKRREAAGEQFNYNLPLPDDRVTKGEGTLRMVKPFKLAEAQVNVSKKDMQAVKKSGIFRPMKRQDGSTCMVARCKGERPVNIFVDEV